MPSVLDVVTSLFQLGSGTNEKERENRSIRGPFGIWRISFYATVISNGFQEYVVMRGQVSMSNFFSSDSREKYLLLRCQSEEKM